MTQPEKNKQLTYRERTLQEFLSKDRPADVKLAKDRIFTRFMEEHLKWQGYVRDCKPEYQHTALEQAGLWAHLADFDSRIGFDGAVKTIQKTIGILGSIEPASWNLDAAQQTQYCMETLSELLHLFQWVNHYGPASDQ